MCATKFCRYNGAIELGTIGFVLNAVDDGGIGRSTVRFGGARARPTSKETVMVATVAAGHRIAEARSMMKKKDVDLLIASPGSDMAYLAGYFGHASERPAFLLIPREGDVAIIIAAFESRSLPNFDDDVRISTYTETQDGFDIVREATGRYRHGVRRIAISDQVWGRFLLRLQSIFEGATFTYASAYLRDLRMRKNDSELELLRAAAERTDRALDTILQITHAGSH